MKRTMNLLCGALALLCLVSLFMPVIAPKYPTALYHPGSDSYTKDYFLVGDYYIAREYWSLAKFALSSGENLLRAAISVSSALLLYWATISLMGEKTRWAGAAAATVDLVVMVYLLARMLGVMAGARWLIIVIISVDTLAAFVVAWVRFFDGRDARYIRGCLPSGK